MVLDGAPPHVLTGTAASHAAGERFVAAGVGTIHISHKAS